MWTFYRTSEADAVFMTTMFLRTSIMAACLAAGTAAPASAADLTQALKPCYVVAAEDQREPIEVKATGFTAFDKVDIYVDEVLQDQPQALFDGSISGIVRAPWQEEGQRSFTLRASEQATPANNLAATSLVTRLSVAQTPSRASTGEHVRFRGRGFTEPGLPVYAHYVFAGKSRKTVRLGLPQGPCGTFSVKRTQFPFKNAPRVGVWTIWFDQRPQYDPKAPVPVRVPMTIKVRRAPKQERAQLR